MKIFLIFISFFIFLSAQKYNDAYKLYSSGDLESSFKMFKELCDDNNFIACFSAGNILNELNLKLQNDKGVAEKNKVEIIQKQSALMISLFQKSCNGNYADACNNLAFFQNQISKSTDKPQNKNNELPSFLAQDSNASMTNQEILLMYEKSCNTGNAQACNNLALFYSKQENHDAPQSLLHFEAACKNNSVMACFDIATKYYNNSDFKNAYTYFNKSCTMGLKEGCLNLGIMYEKNLIESENTESKLSNYTTAMEYYSKACGMGEKNACEYLQDLSQRLYKAK